MHMISPSKSLAILVTAAALAAAGCQHKPKGQSENNRPPEVTEAVIQPEQPTYDALVTLKITALDPDGDQVLYKVEWLVNGQTRASGPSVQFSTKGLAAGDRVSARVLPSDGMAEGQWYQTEEVALWPKVISLDSLRIEPSPLTSGLEQVRALPFVAGVPLDQIRFVYKWTLDGKVLNDTGASVSVPPLKVGQKLVVEAAPVLGTKKGNPFRMMATVVGAPPVIRAISFVRQDEGFYVYRVEAEDPGQEPLSYSLVKAVPGASLDSRTGELRIPVGSTGQGVRVKVTNKSGSFVERNLESSP